MKKCSKCKKFKDYSEFYKNKTRKDGYQHICIECKTKLRIDYIDKNPWLRSYYKAQSRCNQSNSNCYKYYGGKGINFKLSIEEIKKLWIRDKAWLLSKPSIDRIDANKDYDYNNCRFIEHKLNCQLNSCRFPLVLVNKDNIKIGTFTSIRQAIIKTKYSKSFIYKSLKTNEFKDGVKFLKAEGELNEYNGKN